MLATVTATTCVFFYSFCCVFRVHVSSVRAFQHPPILFLLSTMLSSIPMLRFYSVHFFRFVLPSCSDHPQSWELNHRANVILYTLYSLLSSTRVGVRAKIKATKKETLQQWKILQFALGPGNVCGAMNKYRP